MCALNSYALKNSKNVLCDPLYKHSKLKRIQCELLSTIQI